MSLLIGGTFDPSSVGTLKLWLEADSGVYEDVAKTTPAEDDGDLIACWADQSGNGYDVVQATAGYRPTLKLDIVAGRPVLRFAGGGDALAHGTASTWKFMHDSTGFVAFVVLATDSNYNNALLGIMGTTAGSSSQHGTACWYDDRDSQPAIKLLTLMPV
jgi:hypothetical protein